VREGDAVTAGRVLARFDTTELGAAHVAAQADLAAAKSELSTAEWNLEQSRELLKAGAISEQSFRAAEQAAIAARARLAASESRLRSAELSRRDAQVVAPATGTILQRLVQTGERVTRGSQMFVMVRDDTLEFTAALPARAATLVHAGQEVRFTVDGRSFVGRVSRVSPSIDPASRSIAIYVRVPNLTHDLKANAFASGRLVSDTQAEVLAIPVAAIRRSRDDDAPFVYRIEGDQINVAPVRTGTTDEARGMVEIVSGLDTGDRVVIGNVGTIGRGMKVQILDADARGGAGGRGGNGGGRGRRGGGDTSGRQ
jgi:RND family efflux transporter MFP subunit